MLYRVYYYEKFAKNFIVDAESEEEACEIVESMIDDCTIESPSCDMSGDFMVDSGSEGWEASDSDIEYYETLTERSTGVIS